MKKTLINLWRAEIRKEAALWWSSLDEAQKELWAYERTEDEVIEDVIAARMAAIEPMPYPVRYHC